MLDDKEDFFIQRKYTSGKTYFCSLKIDRTYWMDVHSWKGYYYIDVQDYTSNRARKTNRYALDRSLVTPNTIYSKEIIKFIQEIWSAAMFKFSSTIAYERFVKQCEKYNVI